jgi:hypothetical protein
MPRAMRLSEPYGSYLNIALLYFSNLLDSRSYVFHRIHFGFGGTSHSSRAGVNSRPRRGPSVLRGP